MLRRGSQAILPRLLQAQREAGFAPLSAAFNVFPQSFGSEDERPSVCSAHQPAMARSGCRRAFVGTNGA
jgi:hypothetical protein